MEERIDGEERREPLAARMRPRTLDEFVGQEHIIGSGRLLRRAIEADMITAVIFAGPPGTGKTTLARIIAHTTKKEFVSLNAVLGGVKEVREAIATAERYRREQQRGTILFVDEVHRWNKAQQDALLPWVENGTVSFIGATTHNPFFEINNALISRARIFQLQALTDDELHQIIEQALRDQARGYGQYNIVLRPEAAAHIVNMCNGDARSLLNALQLAVENGADDFPPTTSKPIVVDLATAEESIQRKAVLYDRDGDYHYDHISAFIKSVRGSDPDAALYWLAKMMSGGEDPRFIFRRLLILASEDIGLANPEALVVTHAAAAAFEMVGLPEGQFHLSQATLYCALSEKSNSTLGYFDACKVVEQEASSDPPRHLQDGSRDSKAFGHGEGYKYPHAYTDHWVAQQYLPDSLKGRLFYTPHTAGFEGRMRARLLQYRAIQMQYVDSESADGDDSAATDAQRSAGAEHVPKQGSARWLTRISEARIAATENIRSTLLQAVSLRRDSAVWIVGSGLQPYVWGVLSHTAGNKITIGCTDEHERQEIEYHLRQIPQKVRPLLCEGAVNDEKAERQHLIVSVNYARIFLRNKQIPYDEQWRQWLQHLHSALDEERGCVGFIERFPKDNMMLTQVLEECGAAAEIVEMIKTVETELATRSATYRFDAAQLTELLSETGWRCEGAPTACLYPTQRAMSRDVIACWFTPPQDNSAVSPFASVMHELYSSTEVDTARRAITELIADSAGGVVEWPTSYSLVVARRRH